MRTRTGWLAWLLAAGVALGPTTARGQDTPLGPMIWGGGGQSQYYEPGVEDPPVPVPLGHDRYEMGGFFVFGEFLFMRQTNTIEEQLIAIRGFQDTDGTIQIAQAIVTGNLRNPIAVGAFFGSAAPALNAEQVAGPGTYTPGFGVGGGWRFDDGSAIYFRWRHLFESKYNAVASIIPPDLRVGGNAEDSFLFSPVVNFPNAFAGPVSKIGVASTIGGSAAEATADLLILDFISDGDLDFTAFDLLDLVLLASAEASGSLFAPQGAYGIWNGASIMSLSFTQRYDDFELMGRIPIYQGENCRAYGLAGGRHVAFWERFFWRTVALDAAFPSVQAQATAEAELEIDGSDFTLTITLDATAGQPPTTAGGNAAPDDVALYTNVVSNQLWGPSVGMGSEWYLGHGFSFSLDVRAAVFLNIAKEMAKYERGDLAIANKRSKREYTVVPEVDAVANVWWYPMQGVQLFAGYEVAAFFNTVASPKPVSFNYGSLDPPWEKGIFRMLDGLRFGISLIF